MKHALSLFILLWPAWQALAAEPPAAAQQLTLRIRSVALTPAGLNVSYELLNRGKQPVYLIAPDPAASLNNWPNVPFLRILPAEGVLELASYLATPPPNREFEALYRHPLVKIAPGKHQAQFRLPLPLMTNLPYGGKKPERVDNTAIHTLVLRLGVIPCAQAQQVSENIPGGPPYGYVAPNSVIECAGRRDALAAFQAIAEARVAVDWPKPVHR